MVTATSFLNSPGNTSGSLFHSRFDGRASRRHLSRSFCLDAVYGSERLRLALLVRKVLCILRFHLWSDAKERDCGLSPATSTDGILRVQICPSLSSETDMSPEFLSMLLCFAALDGCLGISFAPPHVVSRTPHSASLSVWADGLDVNGEGIHPKERGWLSSFSGMETTSLSCSLAAS